MINKNAYSSAIWYAIYNILGHINFLILTLTSFNAKPYRKMYGIYSKTFLIFDMLENSILGH
jgi:hypothetical protein